MKVRILAAIGAILLAVFGLVLLSAYVGGADARARDGAKAVDVYVVRSSIVAGTTADKLPSLVEQKTITASSMAKGAITSLSQLSGKVATVDLVPGEQLLDSRFADPASLHAAGQGKPVLPTGMQEISVQLEPQRVLGGVLSPGDTVGVFISLPPATPGAPSTTHLTAQKLLVLAVQGATEQQPASGSSTSGAAAPASSAAVAVTLAVNAPTAEKVVFGMEFGKVWLSKELPASSPSGSHIVTNENVYQ